MRHAVLLVCLLLCSCSQESSSDDKAAALISLQKTREVAMHVMLNRYPDARIVSETGAGATYTYRFSTNGTIVPSKIVVDRHAARAHFEDVSR